MDLSTLKNLCLVAFVIFTPHTTNAEISEQTKEAISLGLEAGVALAEVLTDEDFQKSLIGLSKNLKPFLSVLGPMAGIAIGFIPTGDSEELAFMKKEFEKVNRKLDVVTEKVENVKKAIDWSQVAVSYVEYEKNIRAAEENLNRIYRVEGKKRESERKYFVNNYENHFDNSLKHLYDGIMANDHVFSKNILWAVVKQTDYRKSAVEKFSLNLVQLLVQGIKVTVSYRAMKGWDAKHIVQEWDAKMMKVRKRLETVIDKVKGAYESQSKKEVDKLLRHNYKNSNRDLLSKIYDFLEEKYDWRYWFVAVYDDVKGYDKHAISTCGGYTFLHYKNKKNVVVASNVKTSSAFKEKDARKILKDVEDDINGCSKTTRKPGDRARTLRDHLEEKTGGGCSPYAMELVVRTGKGLWYSSSPSHRAFTKIAKQQKCCWDDKNGWWSSRRSCSNVKWSFNVLLFG